MLITHRVIGSSTAASSAAASSMAALLKEASTLCGTLNSRGGSGAGNGMYFKNSAGITLAREVLAPLLSISGPISGSLLEAYLRCVEFTFARFVALDRPQADCADTSSFVHIFKVLAGSVVSNADTFYGSARHAHVLQRNPQTSHCKSYL